MGDTRLLLSRDLILESTRIRPADDPTPNRRRHASRPSPEERGEYAVLLDNIRSAWNVGSILRSADGFAFTHAYLCGITPTPDHEAVTKTSLGAEDSVTWSYHKDAVKLVKGLKKEGWQVWALEEDRQAKSIQMMPLPHTNQRVVLVLGSEVTGVDPGLLDLCDEIFYIPMRGEKKSFNVAMAFSIAAYEIRK
jgi:tRNA G18 (ribose-2'-O)-methylase SpoU